MSWNGSFTAVAGAIFTAAQYNTYNRDNILFLYGNQGIFDLQVRRNNLISPAPASTQNDYAPTGFSTCNRINFNPGAATVQITGFVAQPDGTEIFFWNIQSGANKIQLQHANAGSAAANRLNVSGSVDVDFNPNQGGVLVYNSGQTRWNVYRCNA